ncbi:hypothetical protein OV203_30300 [Nannocystis sp. ILAH1]|uniref:hypothetical protein n=1 Tax=unclassified Nannocystis TaxID=2627009 RepID=UPI002271F117|nr:MULTISPECIES: hypothetical protein [unclassified Nannocystis]MCY0991473.1 hypothetical protein [Nannocystis sp. ILAH1]MCY1066522.1 hypothetical protein [Nannocystis sp. RBIL2]
MNERLRQWDAFIEEISSTLEISPPSSKIRYTWVPEQFWSAERWGCSDPRRGCFTGFQQGIFVDDFENMHEIVHAVDFSGLGGGHPILREGLAEFFGTGRSTEAFVTDFTDRFMQLLSSTGKPHSPAEYVLCMHFVGSIIERHGISLYKEFYAALDRDSSPQEFEAAYQNVFHEDLLDGLLDMSSLAVTGQFVPWPCLEGSDAEVLEWTGEGVLRTTVHGECGDPHFAGPGSVPDSFGFIKHYVIDVEVSGYYRLTVNGTDATAPGLLAASIQSCPAIPFEILVAEQSAPHEGTLAAGRNMLTIYFPPTAALEGDAELVLEFQHSGAP